jgi:hypothetical protein
MDKVQKPSSNEYKHIQPAVTSSFFGVYIFLKVFSDTLTLCSSFKVKDEASRPYKTTFKL